MSSRKEQLIKPPATQSALVLEAGYLFWWRAPRRPSLDAESSRQNWRRHRLWTRVLSEFVVFGWSLRPWRRSIPGVATTSATIAGVSSMSLAPLALNPEPRPRRAGRIDECPGGRRRRRRGGSRRRRSTIWERPQPASPEGEIQQLPLRLGLLPG